MRSIAATAVGSVAVLLTMSLTASSSAAPNPGTVSAAPADRGFPSGVFQIRSERQGECVAAWSRNAPDLVLGTDGMVPNVYAGLTARGIGLQPCDGSKEQQWKYHPQTKKLENLGLDGDRCVEALHNSLPLGLSNPQQQGYFFLRMAWCKTATPAFRGALEVTTEDGMIRGQNPKYSYWTIWGESRISGQTKGKPNQHWTFASTSK